MKKWNLEQKQLVAETLSNLAIGIFLIAVITPLISGIKNAILFILTALISSSFSISIFIVSFRILKK